LAGVLRDPTLIKRERRIIEKKMGGKKKEMNKTPRQSERTGAGQKQKIWNINTEGKRPKLDTHGKDHGLNNRPGEDDERRKPKKKNSRGNPVYSNQGRGKLRIKKKKGRKGIGFWGNQTSGAKKKKAQGPEEVHNGVFRD